MRSTGFDCEEAFSASAERVVAVRAAEVFERSDGVLDMEEVEALHDMRVATRRLRAALEVFAPAFPAKRHRKALKRVKALADALGERRDRDVAIEFLTGFAARRRRPTRRRSRRWSGACARSSGGRTTTWRPSSPPSA